MGVNFLNMSKISDQVSLGIKGVHTFSLCDVRHPKALKIQEEISHVLEVLTDPKKRWELLQALYRELESVSLVEQKTVINIVPTIGRTVLARWLIGDNTYSADTGINYGALGNDNTTPVNADTVLGNETYRKAISSVAYSNNIAYLSMFYTATEVTGTFEEAGLFIVGTGTIDTGQLFSHFLTGTIAKSSTETLTVQSTFTIT